MNNSVFGETMENVRKHKDIKLVTTEKRRNYLVSEQNYHTTKLFSENLLAIEIAVLRSINIKIKQNINVWVLVWLYVKPKYEKKVKLCYMDTKSFNVCVNTGNIYKDTAEDVEARFDTPNFEWDRPLPKGKNKKVIGLMKDELVRKIMTEFAALKAKPNSRLTDNKNEEKNKRVCHKVDLGSLKKDNKEFIKNNKLILKSTQSFRSEKHYEYTEEVNKIALSANNDVRIQPIDSIETYAHGTSTRI